MAKIYVASSWRNKNQPIVVNTLRIAGHEVYDFRNPTDGDKGFHWSEIDEYWEKWTPEQYRENLKHPVAEKGFKSDMDAMKWAEVFVGVMPFGRSASLEMGWAVGHGKTTILLLSDGEPELMVKMLDYICCTTPELINAVNNLKTGPAIDPVVVAFEKTMQYKLNKNKFKECEIMNPDGRGRKWDNCEVEWLFNRMVEETEELLESIELPASAVEIRNECADVGNFAMMIYDKFLSADACSDARLGGANERNRAVAR